MSRDPAVLLEDVAQAASEMAGFIEGLEFEVFNDDIRTQRAVECSFEIIGQALKRLRRNSPQLATRIPELRQALDFRNRLAHAYHLIETQVAWDTAVNDISELQKAVRSLLAELDRAAEYCETAPEGDADEPTASSPFEVSENPLPCDS